MFQYSVPRMELLPEMPPPDLIMFSLSAAAVSLWTCVAVVTAAFGFWRIRAAGSKSDAPSPPPPPPTSTPPLEPNPPLGSTGLTPHKTAACHVELVGSPKAKFTACYSSGGCDVDEEEDAECGEEGGESHRAVAVPWQLGLGLGLELEGLVVSRISRRDLGWYRYQDRMAINGSVVKLWG